MFAATLPDGKPAHRTTSCQGSGPLCSLDVVSDVLLKKIEGKKREGRLFIWEKNQCNDVIMSMLDGLYYWMNEKKLKVKKREGRLRYERKIIEWMKKKVK